MNDISCQNNNAVAECIVKESEFFKSLEKLEKSNQPDAVIDFVVKTFDFSNSFCRLSQFQKNQAICCNCIAFAFSTCFSNLS